MSSSSSSSPPCSLRSVLISGIVFLVLLLLFAFSALLKHQTVFESKLQATNSSMMNNKSIVISSSTSRRPQKQSQFDDLLPRFSESSSSVDGVSSSSICPSFSTSSGLWGLNNPYFNSMNFYKEKNEFDELEGFRRSDKTKDTFGKWIFGPRHSSSTTSHNLSNINLEYLCRQKKKPEFANNHRVLSECDYTKPDKFTPFNGHGKDYELDKSVAYYQQSSKKEDSRSGSSTTSTKLLSWCYDFQSPIDCLRNKTIIFLGDSHIRNIAQFLCRMLLRFFKDTDKWFERGACGLIDMHFDSRADVVYLPRANCTLVYMRIRYKLETQMKNRFLRNFTIATVPKRRVQYHTEASTPSFLQSSSNTAQSLMDNADFVIYGRNLWDYVFVDYPRYRVMEDFTSDLKFLSQEVFTKPKTKFIIKVPHYTHYKHRDEITMSNIRLCSHWTRQIEQRDAIICGLRTFFLDLKKKVAPDEEINADRFFSSINDKFAIFDVFGSSREARVLNGTDHHGHHYEGTVMESMTQQFLSILCPSTIFGSASPDEENKKKFDRFMVETFLKTAKVSCERMEDRKKKVNPYRGYKKIEKCACGDASAIKSDEGKKYCAYLRERQIDAPFVVNE